ncbi:nitroreductase [Agromyces flavus]|uniref:Putative NAD(P)H nitroreductase n=1 Tax=Agromyces flavus TaxID=589382 RepID=A0A1H1M994_9MICO|nr:nitroreductase family protein [Agromyces flavus]MCP2368737.1 nitroreductase [Agromyces flavus]GGI48025.1 nitroreductase [Agromyces flavus]SDR83230.1 Nitroreductase [Agromyces flavus]
MGAVRTAALARRSWPKVTDVAPSDAELAELLEAAGRVSDHGGLVPWRVIALRDEARSRLGDALVQAAGLEGDEAAKLAAKPLRAPVLLALVAVVRPHPKVPEWEQEACAAGVGHLLTLLLDEAGWGVMWRTGPHTRHPSVARAHGLADGERLMGWLYVGGKPESGRPERRRAPVAEGRLSELA